MGKIRIVIADDHEIVRKGVRKVLDEQPDMEVVGEAADGLDAVDKVRSLLPDVALIDIGMPLRSGLEAVRLIKEAGLETRMVILSLHKKDAYVHQAFQCGAIGYLVKPTHTAVIFDAIRTAFRGEYFLSPQIQSSFIREFLRKLKERGVSCRGDMESFH